jgi:hypothetical protein
MLACAAQHQSAFEWLRIAACASLLRSCAALMKPDASYAACVHQLITNSHADSQRVRPRTARIKHPLKYAYPHSHKLCGLNPFYL